MEKTSNQILEELWACRERELIRNIAKGRDIDFQSLIDEFASKSAQKEIKTQEKKTKKIREIPHLEKCRARVWDSSKSCPGGQCSRKGGKGPGKDLCGNHAKSLEKNGELPQGRFEDENQEKIIKVVQEVEIDKQVEKLVNKIVEQQDEQQDEQQHEQQDEQVEEQVDEQDVEQVEVEEQVEQVVEEEALSDSSSKKKRGRPKGFTKKPKDTPQEFKGDEELLEEETHPVKVVKKEEKKSVELSSKVMDSLQKYVEGTSDLNDIKFTNVKKALTAKIGPFECDTKKLKSALKDTIEKTKNEREEEEGEESDESEEEEEEITTKEITVEGKKYLLDPKTLKVYDSSGDNDFLGKYDGNSIDFDAVDSDDDE